MIYFTLFLLIICLTCKYCIVNGYNYGDGGGAPCPYFGGDRVSEAQGNLINCTWYSNNACCQRTEVTSVFGGMYSLYRANKECSNHLNYMMCYFCSPDQHLWIENRNAHLCPNYCESILKHCRDAIYNDASIGSMYKTGKEFCEGQKFKVEKHKGKCFDYDPLVFGTASSLFNQRTIVVSLTVNILFVLCLR